MILLRRVVPGYELALQKLPAKAATQKVVVPWNQVHESTLCRQSPVARPRGLNGRVYWPQQTTALEGLPIEYDAQYDYNRCTLNVDMLLLSG